MKNGGKISPYILLGFLKIQNYNQWNWQFYNECFMTEWSEQSHKFVNVVYLVHLKFFRLLVYFFFYRSVCSIYCIILSSQVSEGAHYSGSDPNLFVSLWRPAVKYCYWTFQKCFNSYVYMYIYDKFKTIYLEIP